MHNEAVALAAPAPIVNVIKVNTAEPVRVNKINEAVRTSFNAG
jgi:hypothetical protein